LIHGKISVFNDSLTMADTQMSYTLKDRLLQFTTLLQRELFAWAEAEERALTSKHQEVIRILELVEIERYVPSYRGCVGRHGQCRLEIARAFIAKQVLNLPTTEALIDRLKVDICWRRICGFENSKAIPGSWTFSRAYAEFAALGLATKTHEALIKRELGDQLIGHIKYDSTAIEARETAAKPRSAEAKPKAKRGRPRQGEECPPTEPTVLEKQQKPSLEQMLKEMPKAGDVGCKNNSKGYKETWRGYQLHLATADGDIPMAALLSSTSMHDSGAMLPLMRMVQQRVISLDDIADSADCSTIIRDESRQAGHVPLMEHHPRNGDKIEFAPHEAQRYQERSGAERPNRHWKDNRGGRMVRVRGHDKVYAHLRFGLLSIAAEPRLRLLT
jgi:hypothetical protein